MHWLIRKILFLWVRVRVLPADVSRESLAAGQSVCYVAETNALSNYLVLYGVCEKNGLPLPREMVDKPAGKSRSIAYLRRFRGVFMLRTDGTVSPTLQDLVNNALADPSFEVRIVPVSFFLGTLSGKGKILV